MNLEQLISCGPVVTDGAWGTRLQSLGLPIGACPDPWNLEHPELVERVAREYVEAGSQVILTNTFRANRLALASHGIGDSIVMINAAGVQISRKAAAGRALVFASIGPSGRMLLAGDVTEDELSAAFAEQSAALAQAGADALLIETMGDLTEARLAVDAARSTGLPVAVSMVFDSGANRDRTMMGVTPEEAAQTLTAAGADIIGANCGQGIEGFVEICRRLRASTDRPIWIKANAGLPQLVGDRAIYPTSPEQFARYVPQLRDLGVCFVGGCCGTSPEFIEAIRRELGR